MDPIDLKKLFAYKKLKGCWSFKPVYILQP